MARVPSKTATVPRRRRPDPTGRVDVLAIRLMEYFVGKYGDLPLRGLYGTYKKDIDRTVKRHLGKIRFYFPEGTAAQLGLEEKRHAR